MKIALILTSVSTFGAAMAGPIANSTSPATGVTADADPNCKVGNNCDTWYDYCRRDDCSYNPFLDCNMICWQKVCQKHPECKPCSGWCY